MNVVFRRPARRCFPRAPPTVRRTAGQLLFNNREPIEDFLAPRSPTAGFWEPDGADKSIFTSGVHVPKWKALYESVRNGSLPASTLANSIAMRRVQSVRTDHFSENHGRYLVYDGLTEFPQANGKLRIADQRIMCVCCLEDVFCISESSVLVTAPYVAKLTPAAGVVPRPASPLLQAFPDRQSAIPGG